MYVCGGFKGKMEKPSCFLLFNGQRINMFTLQEEDFGLRDLKLANTTSE